jgi:hypothetical protein
MLLMGDTERWIIYGWDFNAKSNGISIPESLFLLLVYLITSKLPKMAVFWVVVACWGGVV